MRSLEAETLFITGATSGFGEATARRCAKEGARLVICGRRKERLEALQKELSSLTQVYALVLDVREKQKVEEAIESLPEAFRAVTVLVNNAGLALGLERAHECLLEQWEQMIDTNIKGLVYCTRKLLPGMVERKKGYVINIGSTAGSYPYPGGNVYGATKAFVKQFSLNLRADLLGTPVRVTIIEPGLAETEFSLVRFSGDAEKAQKVYDGTQPIQAEDVAEAVLWCVQRPPHININRIEIMPVCQASGSLAVSRNAS